MSVFRARVTAKSRLSLPAALCREVGLKRGDVVILELEGRTVSIRTANEVIDRARVLTKHLLSGKPDASVESFLALRR